MPLLMIFWSIGFADGVDSKPMVVQKFMTMIMKMTATMMVMVFPIIAIIAVTNIMSLRDG